MLLLKEKKLQLAQKYFKRFPNFSIQSSDPDWDLRNIPSTVQNNRFRIPNRSFEGSTIKKLTAGERSDATSEADREQAGAKSEQEKVVRD